MPKVTFLSPNSSSEPTVSREGQRFCGIDWVPLASSVLRWGPVSSRNPFQEAGHHAVSVQAPRATDDTEELRRDIHLGKNEDGSVSLITEPLNTYGDFPIGSTGIYGWTTLSDEQIQKLAEEIIANFGRYHVLLNNCQRFARRLLRAICFEAYDTIELPIFSNEPRYFGSAVLGVLPGGVFNVHVPLRGFAATGCYRIALQWRSNKYKVPHNLARHILHAFPRKRVRHVAVDQPGFI